MLNKNDREHIKLLYDNFLKINIYIKKAIENKDLETVGNIFETKNKLIKEIVSFEKIYHNEIKKDKELYEFKMDLIQKEKENIDLLNKLKAQTAQEVVKMGKIKKIYNTYEPSLNETRSTFDISDEDE